MQSAIILPKSTSRITAMYSITTVNLKNCSQCYLLHRLEETTRIKHSTCDTEVRHKEIISNADNGQYFTLVLVYIFCRRDNGQRTKVSTMCNRKLYILPVAS